MTRVCLVGAEDATLRADLRASETARDALSTYDIQSTWANTVAVDTISIGAAVSLLNDLNWYLVRLTAAAMVLEPSVSETEWLSRALATDIRNEAVNPADTGSLLKIYGVVSAEGASANDEEGAHPDRVAAVGGQADDPDAERGEDRAAAPHDSDEAPEDGDGGLPRLTEPMYTQRVTDETPAYDLRDVDDTVVVRVTPDEFGG